MENFDYFDPSLWPTELSQSGPPASNANAVDWSGLTSTQPSHDSTGPPRGDEFGLNPYNMGGITNPEQGYVDPAQIHLHSSQGQSQPNDLTGMVRFHIIII
jgi:hypothetical protein